MIPHVIIISYIALPHAHAHFDWASPSPHCSSAAEIFRIHSNARNSIKPNLTRPRNLALHSVFHVSNLCVIFVCLDRETHLHSNLPFLVVETVRSLRMKKVCMYRK